MQEVRPSRGQRPAGLDAAAWGAKDAVTMTTEQDIRRKIAGEIYTALERLGADPELLAIVGSWRDTLPDAEVLLMLRDWNAGRPMLHRPQ
jgi:hypothetical protein